MVRLLGKLALFCLVQPNGEQRELTGDKTSISGTVYAKPQL